MPSDAKPSEGSERRVNDAFARWKWVSSSGERTMASLRRFLEGKLKLKVNEGKSSVVRSTELIFLGFAFKGGKIVWSGKSLMAFKRHIRELTSRN